MRIMPFEWGFRGRVRLHPILALSTALALASCGGVGTTATRSPTSSPTSSPALRSLPALKLDVLSAVGGRLAFCDPDVYPIEHGTPLQNAEARLPQIQADRAAYAAILAYEHISPGIALTSAEKIRINQDYKQLQVIQLEPAGVSYRFDVLASVDQSGSPVTQMAGTVSRTGHVVVESRRPGRFPMCPICLAVGTLISTPQGPVPVQDMRTGGPVWTLDAGGRRLAATVLRTGHVDVPPWHRVLVITLADGRAVTVSPGHPLPDGRPVAALRAGDALAGSVVVSIVPTAYAGGATWDLLPSGPTGTYFAGGIPLRSTLWHGSAFSPTRAA
jgi:hypothetical protein